MARTTYPFTTVVLNLCHSKPCFFYKWNLARSSIPLCNLCNTVRISILIKTELVFFHFHAAYCYPWLQHKLALGKYLPVANKISFYFLADYLAISKHAYKITFSFPRSYTYLIYRPLFTSHHTGKPLHCQSSGIFPSFTNVFNRHHPSNAPLLFPNISSQEEKERRVCCFSSGPASVSLHLTSLISFALIFKRHSKTIFFSTACTSPEFKFYSRHCLPLCHNVFSASIPLFVVSPKSWTMCSLFYLPTHLSLN